MKVIILAGGGGTRLFPMSRLNYPKQFLKINNEQSLLVQTVTRFLPLVEESDIIIVTNQEYIYHVKNELSVHGVKNVHILAEPAARNTCPAIVLASRFCLDELSVLPDETLLITPSDHIIRNTEDFLMTIRKSEELARLNKIVTFGIKPDKPETGYGYIKAGRKCGCGFEVDAFREKPDRVTAEQYIAENSYYWNSGMYAFTAAHLLDEMEKCQPEIYRLSKESFKALNEQFAAMPDISFDYAVAEKSRDVVTIPLLNAYWSDIGSWDAIYEVWDKDVKGNAIHGDCFLLDCNNTLMFGQDRIIAGIGLEDMLLVETDDVIVVAKKGESQKVKDVVSEFKRRGRREVVERTTVHRPWGHYTAQGKGNGYKIKKIVVQPGQRLSLHLHYHRSEHWIVISGTAEVRIGESAYIVNENQSIFVPQAARHRLENKGKIPLEIIEIQNGRYLEEDDIVRFDE